MNRVDYELQRHGAPLIAARGSDDRIIDPGDVCFASEDATLFDDAERSMLTLAPTDSPFDTLYGKDILIKNVRMASIEDQIQTSLGLNKMLNGRVENAAEPQDPRDKMALRAARYTADLHKAMATLVEKDQHGAAYVLARPLVEASIAALYLLYAVTEDKAAAMVRNEANLPDTKIMVKKCRDIGEYGPNLEKIWSEISPFHKYTHGDTIQINRNSKDHHHYQEAAWLLFLSDVVTLAAFEVAAIALEDEELQNDVISLRDVSATLLLVRSGADGEGRELARLSPPKRSAQAQSSP